MAATLPRTSLPRTSTTTLSRNPAAAWRHLDVVLIGAVLSVAALGVLMVYSATRGPVAPYQLTYLEKQGTYVLIGLAILVLIMLFDYRTFRDWAYFIYGASCLMLIAVVSPFGSTSKGAQSWFQIGSFQLQPSEFVKIALILALAALASQFHTEIDLRRLVALLALAGFPIALIMLQPDLGTAMVLGIISAGMLVLAGAQPKHLLALLLITIVGVTFVLRSDFLAQYQKDRLLSFTQQDQELSQQAYNTNQSKIAIGQGGPFGVGLFQGSQTRLGNVPEQHTDFIFTAVGEQLGFIGGGTLLALFCIIAWRIWRSAQLARDEFGMLVCVGVLCLFMFQIFENVGMTMGIMPVTGIPLPFVSYGGSSTIAEFVGIGLVLNVHMRRFS
jgi:rod shape determining protein RodA